MDSRVLKQVNRDASTERDTAKLKCPVNGKSRVRLIAFSTLQCDRSNSRDGRSHWKFELTEPCAVVYERSLLTI